MIFPALLHEWSSRGIIPSVLKRGAQYFSIQTSTIKMNDVLNFSSPCNLVKYLKQWKASASKTIFPYQFFSTVEELKACREFPPQTAFHSTLSNSCVSDEEYADAKSYYYKCLNLPEGHPEKMHNMVSWLKFYNLLDVSPLLEAITNSFECYHRYFGIDATAYLSLPSIAMKAIMRCYDQRCSYIFTFAKPFNDIRDLHRSNITGGCCACYHRYVNLVDDSGPVAARFAPNGKRFTYFIQLDFNSLYGKMQQKRMPTTPGIIWQKCKRGFKKNVMATGVSLKSMQWLYWLQATSTKLLRKDGSREKIQHGFHHKEVEIQGDSVDGYACVDGQILLYEFQGCFVHGGCCVRVEGEEKKVEQWTQKHIRLRQHGVLYVMQECDWDKLHPTIISTPTHFPRILYKYDTETTLLEGVRSNNVFGFILCDIWASDDIIDKMKSNNFPPIFQKVTLTEDHLSEYMLKRFQEEGRTLDQRTLIQTYRAKQILLLTSLVRFYLSIGLEVRNVTNFTQYLGEKSLKPFIDKVTEMRIEASRPDTYDITKSNTAKIIGNSGIYVGNIHFIF